MLGVVSFDTTLYGPASMLFGIERAAHDAGYFIIVASMTALDRPSLANAVERLRVQGVDGILVIAPLDVAAEALRYAPDDIPLVAMTGGPPGEIPVVEVDQISGAAQATGHLLDLGHSNVSHIAGPPGFIEATRRREGWKQTLESAGIAPPAPLTGDWSSRSGYELGSRLAADARVTAVFVANDQMALGVLRAMHEHGRRIPADVSVIGFDDIPEAAYLLPPLTTIRQDFLELGNRALRLMLQTIEAGDGQLRGSSVEPELIVRASTGSAPRRPS
jgi:DNA-binding LacI/PurR family transcriptional regulator